jgi:hypothetical protein
MVIDQIPNPVCATQKNFTWDRKCKNGLRGKNYSTKRAIPYLEDMVQNYSEKNVFRAQPAKVLSFTQKK